MGTKENVIRKDDMSSTRFFGELKKKRALIEIALPKFGCKYYFPLCLNRPGLSKEEKTLAIFWHAWSVYCKYMFVYIVNIVCSLLTLLRVGSVADPDKDQMDPNPILHTKILDPDPILHTKILDTDSISSRKNTSFACLPREKNRIRIWHIRKNRMRIRPDKIIIF